MIEMYSKQSGKVYEDSAPKIQGSLGHEKGICKCANPWGRGHVCLYSQPSTYQSTLSDDSTLGVQTDKSRSTLHYSRLSCQAFLLDLDCTTRHGSGSALNFEVPIPATIVCKYPLLLPWEGNSRLVTWVVFIHPHTSGGMQLAQNTACTNMLLAAVQLDRQ